MDEQAHERIAQRTREGLELISTVLCANIKLKVNIRRLSVGYTKALFRCLLQYFGFAVQLDNTRFPLGACLFPLR